MRSVEKGSRAEQAGFRAGDVIVKVNGESISDSGDFTHAIHGRKSNCGHRQHHSGAEGTEPHLDRARPQPVRSFSIWMKTLEIPDTDAETVIDLSEVQSEIAHLKPEIERAVARFADKAQTWKKPRANCATIRKN